MVTYLGWILTSFTNSDTMKLGILLFISITFSVFGYAQTRTYQDSSLHVKYHTTEGRINGKYESYYPSGKKKSIGAYRNNYKTGIWKVWNQEGELIHTRKYLSPFEFELIYPKPSNNATVQLMNKPVYKLERDSTGIYKYSHLEERTVRWSKRIWRVIPSSVKPVLIQSAIFNAIESNSINLYNENNDEMSEEIKLSKAQLASLKKQRITGFKIKEESFFENNRMVFETRIIGVKPIFEDSRTLSFWMYYPQLRASLAQVKIQIKNVPEIENLDDLFFFRYFSGQIIRESTYPARAISDYAHTKAEQLKESERIEMVLTETEIDLWLSFYGN